MDRREMFGAFGSLGFGLTLGAATTSADHGDKKEKVTGPADGLHAHFCGIHVAKHDPKIQMIVQHYCGPANGLHQCLLFDSSAKDAKLIGVEYIIPDEAFRKLDDREKIYWHPHTYEVLAGGLIAPTMKPDDEMAFMKVILTTWGKTWHTWPDPTTTVPLGEPMLMWAVTGDGQLAEEVIARRDKQFGVKVEKIREKRTKEIGFAVPQVPFPSAKETVGRQWTKDGDDKPTKLQ
jgi:hypothetical protein